jgi:hypothetical protein
MNQFPNATLRKPRYRARRSPCARTSSLIDAQKTLLKIFDCSAQLASCYTRLSWNEPATAMMVYPWDDTFHADAVDMVSAGIARVCETNGVPHVIIRVLSDNADESASADFAAFVQNYKEPFAAIVAVRLTERFATAKAY